MQSLRNHLHSSHPPTAPVMQPRTSRPKKTSNKTIDRTQNRSQLDPIHLHASYPPTAPVIYHDLEKATPLTLQSRLGTLFYPSLEYCFLLVIIIGGEYQRYLVGLSESRLVDELAAYLPTGLGSPRTFCDVRKIVLDMKLSPKET